MTAVLAEVEAEIRLADAAEERRLRVRREELELAQLEAEAAEAAEERKQKKAQLKRTTRKTTRKTTREGNRARRRAARKAWRERFQAALAGRLVLLLVFSAVVTAWYGQAGYLSGPVDQGGRGLAWPFAVTGATALEVLGLAMGAIARAAGEHRDRALRARLLMWAVIAFSAWSNWQHNGVVLAALSILGPTSWEIHEWWQRRAKLHEDGKLRARPVRPRFPLDQVLLFPVRTLLAYRVAVRDRIEDAELALDRVRIERETRRAFGRRNRRRFAKAVRESIDSSNRALADRARSEIEAAREIRAEAEGILAAGALLLGPDRVREVAEPITAALPSEADPIEPGEPIEASRSTDDQGHPIRRRRLFRSIGRRSDTRPEPIENGAADPIEAPATDPIEPTRSAPESIEQPGPIGSGEPIEQAPAAESEPIERTADTTKDASRSVHPIRRRSARGKPIEQLRREAAELIEAKGWTPEQITADNLRTALRCSPKRAREIRDYFQQRPNTSQAAA
ncbi:DUF2637 domain-containing protein [Amycolatopsis keratiniphila]|uniref:DUF2637 domain-containing protein n=1 Tax=Amycolatopsis keratiniphila subsp. keratiniphila TaxID=227715 RepID=A0A1W2M259_9PSEU|nr:DUF2637 domain-containing protein [Amycolatopsis keratiniphila]ONF73941.1 hypothetical protein AVR91_0204210 [Amycolatopsis keratiniphila subsp. keratiniphila]